MNEIELQKIYERRVKIFARLSGVQHFFIREDTPIVSYPSWLQFMGLMETAYMIDRDYITQK